MGFKTLNEVDFADGTVQLIADETFRQQLKRGVVLVPQPSEDPNDPLKWSKWKKFLAFTSTCTFTFLTTWFAGGLAPGFANIAQQFDVNIAKTAGLLNWPVLVLGLSNFFWVPNAIYFGKRPVFLVSCTLLFIASIWGAVAKSFDSLLASSIVGAFGGSATEAVGAAIVNDLFFLHERGAMMGFYIVAISWGSSFGPLVGGYIIDGLGWRWQKWITAILVGLNLGMILFLVPETRFPRLTVSAKGSVPAVGTAQSIDAGSQERRDDADEKSDIANHPRKTTVQELKPWSGIDHSVSYFQVFLRPFPLIFYPAVAFATILYSGVLGPIITYHTISSFVLEAPPYYFSPGAIGLNGVSGLIGNAIGGVVGGYLTDVWAEHQARRNKGIFEPESRLTLLIFPTIIAFTGLLMIGFASEQKLHWAVIYVGFGFLSVALTASANIGMTYVMDSYYAVAPECLLLVNGLKNVVAFGFAYAAIPWSQSQGYARCFGGLAGIFMAVSLLAIPLFIWGARIRHHSAEKWALISW